MKFRIICFVLLFAAILSLSAGGASVSGALAILEDNLAQAKLRRQNAETALVNAEDKYSDALAKKQAIDQKIYALNVEIDALVALIDGYNAQIEEKNTQIEEKTLDSEKQYSLVRQRIRAKREDGSANYLAMILESGGLSDFFSRIDRFLMMLSYDAKVLASYNEGISELKVLKDGLTKQRADLDAQMKELEARKRELEDDLADAGKLVATSENLLESAERDLKNIAAIELEYENKREELLLEYARTTNESYIEGDFLWPLPSKHTDVSSGFGWRIHPVTGKQQFHQGIDIPAPYGTEIYAVKDGTVIECSYNYADGYFITISHGGGVASFYSHLSKYNVKVGDKVTKGQVIANVGTSGYTTGAHLNLNMYKNNAAHNPLDFFN